MDKSVILEVVDKHKGERMKNEILESAIRKLKDHIEEGIKIGYHSSHKSFPGLKFSENKALLDAFDALENPVETSEVTTDDIMDYLKEFTDLTGHRASILAIGLCEKYIITKREG
jgi:hypothetical protein